MHSEEDSFFVKCIVHQKLEFGFCVPNVIGTVFKLNMNDWRVIITWPPMYLTNSNITGCP